ncbi:MAG: hypothetical protein U0360_03225 [Dehalococcoidia bacterium]
MLGPVGQWTFAAIVFTVEAVLLGLALAHARTGQLEVLVWRLTRLLAVATVLVSLLAAYSAIQEITTFGYPWTRPGNLLGTYAEPTALGVGMVAVDGVAFALAAAVAFFRPRIAIGILVIIAALGAIDAVRWLFDPTAPTGNAVLALVVGPPLPALTLAALLWSLRGPLLGTREA